MKNSHGILVVLKSDPTKIMHALLFDNEPNQTDWLNTYKELESEEKYGFVGKKFYLLPATTQDIKNLLSIPDICIEEVHP